MTKEEVVKLVQDMLKGYHLVPENITTDELVHHCRIPKPSFYKRNLHKHYRLRELRFKCGNSYVYNYKAIEVLNDLLQRDVWWDSKRNCEIIR